MQASPARGLHWLGMGVAALRTRLGPNVWGMLLMLLYTACMGAMYVTIRKVPGGMHPFEIAFFRNLFGLLVLLALHAPGGLRVFRTERLGLHAVRGLLNVVAMLAFFTAIGMAPLATVSALNFTAPLFASLLALVVLRERLQVHRLLAIGVGLAGALIIIRPGGAEVGLGPLLVVFSSAVWAVALMVIKVLSRTESSATVVIYMMATMTPLSLLAAVWFWQWPDLEQLGWLVTMAVLGTAGQMSLTESFRSADVTAVLPLEFCKLLWAAGLGYLVFAEVPEVWTFVGGATIFGSTLYLALRERRT